MAEEAIKLLFGVDGGGSIDGKSGKQIVDDLTHIVNQINEGSTSVPKLQLQLDTDHVKTALEELKAQLQEIASLCNLNLPNAAVSRDSGGSASVKQDNTRYRELTATVKQYYAALADVEKIQMKTTDVKEVDGTWTTEADSHYKARIDKINTLKTAFDQLEIKVNEAGAIEMKSAEELNITEEQRTMLLEQVRSSITANAIAHEKSSAQISAAWDKNAAKVHEYILRMREVASKNPEVAEMMDDLDRLAASDNPQNLDALTTGFTRLQQKIRETGADIETWGQKMSKTFGTRVRSLLAGIAVGKVTQYLRDVYNNIVNIDKAIVNLQIATGKTRAEVKQLVQSYAQLAKQLGATTTEVAEGADTWLRQGYSAEEANTLIKNSTMLAKLGQMESAEAAKALTSAMKGYKVEVENSINIIDKFTAVDMEAAASAGDIATAMAETAASADVAGVSMDKLIGYIATVKEVTQDGAESVGTFYKTLFARMNNVAAGNFVDEETGESLNDVETVLNELGIALRDANGQFKNSGEVLDEVAARWESFDSVSRRAIATAFAGTRQQEKFIVLMENYGSAIQYAATSANAAGTANEKFGAWVEGIEGKINSLKAAFEEFSMTFLDSELVTGVIEFLTWLLEALDTLIGSIGGLNTVLYVTAAVILTIKIDSIVSMVMNLIGLIPALITMIITFTAALKAAWGHGLTLGSTLSAAFNEIGISASAAQIAVGAFAAVLGICLIAVNSYNQAVQESINNSLSAADAANAEGKEYLETAKSINELVDEYEELAKQANNGVFSSESAEKVRSIQSKITDLVGDQADNLDLVNGKLDEEIRKMRELATGTGGAVDNAIKKGETQIAEATNAYREMVDYLFASENLIIGESTTKYLFGAYTSGGLSDFTKQWTDQFEIKLRNHQQGGSIGLGSYVYNYGLQSNFDTIEEFISQYEKISALMQELAKEHGETELFKAASTFITDYKSIYEKYQSGKLLIEEANKVKNETEDLFDEPSSNAITVALKSAYDILSEVQDGYDGLASALTDVTSEGYLTANALSTLFKLEEDNALAGLKLADILTRDANGYKLASDALQQYVQALINQYTITEAFATQQDKENAIANLKTLQAVLATLAQTQEESTDADKKRREELEKQQDAYNDQLDAYRELIDIRKDLLQTYEEELSYQNELAKRQRNITSLQTKLAVARLDQSAAGQARVRELEAELKEAQEDLEDFTLEHAIDVLSSQLDNQYTEYEAFIKRKLDKITELLEGLGTTPEVNDDTSWVERALTQITLLINGYSPFPQKLPDVNGDEVDNDSTAFPFPGVYYTPPTLPSGWSVGDPFPVATKTRWTSYQDAADAGYSNIRTRSEFARSNNSDKQKYGTYQAYLDGMYEKYMGKAPVYHSGGLVGDIATLSSSEEFAKLLKGEFVSTPAQMKRFMEETIPKIANYYATGGSNEFNAPLIEITCESVTTEALPELERIVNEAVKEIKRELDSGMSRTGFKRTPTKRLT